MRILIVSQYFYPENFRVNEIAFYLSNKGYKVTVLTSKPNYPKGKFFKGYNFFNKNTEYIDGVKVIRIPTIPRLNGGVLGMALNYFSFLFFGFFSVFFRISNNYDVILATQLSPVLSLLPAVWIKKKHNIPIVLWVLDLWPESFFANTNFRIKFLDILINKISNKIYNNSDSILITSNYFKSKIKKRLVSDKKFIFFPNWAEDIFNNAHLHKIKNEYLFPEGFNIVFTGNIGYSQGFEDILIAAKLTHNYPINWILIGDGRRKEFILNEIKKHNIKNIFLAGRHPLEFMPYYFSKADCLLITLKQDEVFSNTIPGKFQSYLTAGKPILGNVSGEVMQLITKHNLGLACEPGNPELLSELAIKFSKSSKSKLNEFGENSLKLHTTVFRKELIFESLIDELNLLHNNN